jgi:hypothetical protein
MLGRIVRTISTVSLGYALALLPVLSAADDEKQPSSATAKAPDWSGYRFVGDVVGEIVKADDKKLVLRVTWFEPQAQAGGKNNRRPQLSQNNRNFRNPYAPNQNRPNNQQRANVKEQHHDYELEFVPESLVRTKSMPQKYDDNGKRVAHTQKEIDELRAPPGVTGYAASPADLVPGAIVEVILVRDKSIPASKATEDDLRVEYAIILGPQPAEGHHQSEGRQEGEEEELGPQLVLCSFRRRHDFRFPIRIVGLKRKRHAARTIHNRPEAARQVRGFHVGRSAALGAVTRHQEPHVRHRGAQFSEFLRVRRADNRADIAESARADCGRVPVFDRVRDVAIKRFAVADQVLKEPRARITRPH